MSPIKSKSKEDIILDDKNVTKMKTEELIEFGTELLQDYLEQKRCRYFESMMGQRFKICVAMAKRKLARLKKDKWDQTLVMENKMEVIQLPLRHDRGWSKFDDYESVLKMGAIKEDVENKLADRDMEWFQEHLLPVLKKKTDMREEMVGFHEEVDRNKSVLEEERAEELELMEVQIEEDLAMKAAVEEHRHATRLERIHNCRRSWVVAIEEVWDTLLFELNRDLERFFLEAKVHHKMTAERDFRLIEEIRKINKESDKKLNHFTQMNDNLRERNEKMRPQLQALVTEKRRVEKQLSNRNKNVRSIEIQERALSTALKDMETSKSRLEEYQREIHQLEQKKKALDKFLLKASHILQNKRNEQIHRLRTELNGYKNIAAEISSNLRHALRMTLPENEWEDAVKEWEVVGGSLIRALQILMTEICKACKAHDTLGEVIARRVRERGQNKVHPPLKFPAITSKVTAMALGK